MPTDNVLIVSDLSQIELRVLGHFTQDKRLLAAYRDGLDLHSLLAARVFGEDFTPEDRIYAKNGNFCVPLDTEALTRRGWLTYDQLSIGDEVLGYDNGFLRWTPITNLMLFNSAPLISLENHHFKAVTTAEHRWVGEHRKQYGHGASSVRKWERSEITTGGVMSEDRIILSVPLYGVRKLPITPAETALIAWLWTDGFIERGVDVGAPAQSHGKKVMFSAKIFQSKPEGVVAIEEMLMELGAPVKRMTRPAKHSLAGDQLRPIQVWKISADYMRELWQRARLDELTPVQFVAHLGSAEVLAFAKAAWQAEGWVDIRGGRIMAQNEGPVYDAMALAVFLTGHFPNISSNGFYKGTENFNIRFGKPYVNGTRLRKTALGNYPVWCLQNELGSWVMRQGHQIMLTGNSVAFGASPETLVRKYGFPSIKVATAVRDGFYSTYRNVMPWKGEVWAEARRKYKRGKSPPYVSTILGRKRRLPDLHSTVRGVRAGAERQAISSIIQGSAADLFKLGMIECYKMLEERPWDGHIVMAVHDELVVLVPRRHKDEGLQIVKTAMEMNTHPATGEPLLCVPVIADAKIAERWSDGK